MNTAGTYMGIVILIVEIQENKFSNKLPCFDLSTYLLKLPLGTYTYFQYYVVTYRYFLTNQIKKWKSTIDYDCILFTFTDFDTVSIYFFFAITHGSCVFHSPQPSWK